MSTPECPYCAGSCVLLVQSRDYNRGTTDRRFDYFQCERCGLVAMAAIPEDLRPFYAGGYTKIPDTLEKLRAIAETERYRLPVLRLKESGKLLEIGPWCGVFCINAKDAGFEVSAIEMDSDCVRFLRETVGVDAVQSIDPAVTMAGMTEHFDFIALWHALEHLREPWKVIAAAVERLAPGGILLLALPNIESYEFHLLRERWRHLDAPRHLFFYPSHSLITLCESLGLTTESVETHDHLSELLARDNWFEWTKRHFGLHSQTRRLSNLVYRWSRWRERKRPHSGSGITALFRKI